MNLFEQYLEKWKYDPIYDSKYTREEYYDIVISRFMEKNPDYSVFEVWNADKTSVLKFIAWEYFISYFQKIK